MREFEKEFEMLQQHGWRRMPFGEIFKDESLRKIFEHEFEKAPYKFSDRKFIEAPLKLSEEGKLIDADSDLTESDMRDALDEARFSYNSNKEIKRLAKYEVHDIQQTNIYKALRKIGQTLENFKAMRNINPENLMQVAQEMGSAIHREIKRFDSEPLREAIIKAIIDNDNNDVLIWSGKVNERDYRQFKMYLNNYLSKPQVDYQANSESSFEDIFVNDKAKQKCLDILEELEITNNGEPNNLTKGKAGKVGGAIIALRETPNMFKDSFTERRLSHAFSKYLGFDFTRFNKKGKKYAESYDDAKRILKSMKS